MFNNKNYASVLKIFLLIFVIFSLKVLGDSLLNNLNVGKKEEPKAESEILRKKLISNTAFVTEIVKLCRETRNFPKSFLQYLRDEYQNNFKRLNELKSKNVELEVNLTVNHNVEDYISLQMEKNFKDSNLSRENYCQDYDFTNIYNSMENYIIGMDF
ncbi:hypothetical protein HDR60_04050 [bacterium]|nr:hypothetical protein [bacterium]